jgi:hypothetical protein
MQLYELFAGATRYFIAQDAWLPHTGGRQQIQSMTGAESVQEGARYISVLTFESAMKYFKTDAPQNHTVKKGLLLREKTKKGLRIVQAFVDEQDEIIVQPDKNIPHGLQTLPGSPEDIPYGRQITVGSLDEELLDAFGDGNLIIVE